MKVNLGLLIDYKSNQNDNPIGSLIIQNSFKKDSYSSIKYIITKEKDDNNIITEDLGEKKRLLTSSDIKINFMKIIQLKTIL